jgi:hypothetical protein
MWRPTIWDVALPYRSVLFLISERKKKDRLTAVPPKSDQVF